MRERPHYFTRTVGLQNDFNLPPQWTFLGGGVNGWGGHFTGGYTFDLAQLDDYQSLSNIFEFYRIISVTFTWVPTRNVAPTGLNTGAVAQELVQGIPTLMYYFDLTDITISTPEANTEAPWLNNQRVHTKRLSRPQSYRFRPKPQLESLGGANMAATRKWWIPTNHPSEPHYGLKYRIYFPDWNPGAGTDEPQFNFRLYAKFRLAFKNHRIFDAA